MICLASASYSHAGSSSPEDKYQSLRTDRMATRDLAIRVIFLIQTVVGILGNLSLLYHYVLFSFTGCRPRPTDLIVKNLIVANILILVSFGIHHTLSTFGWYNMFSDFGCKFFPYVRGVSRGVSIGMTCLLSVFQAITISPQNSRWTALKEKALKCLVPSLVLCWVLQILINIMYPVVMGSTLNKNNLTNRKSFGYCSAVRYEKTRNSLNTMLLTLPDVLYVGLMLWASISMVFLLYQHKQRVQHIHRTSVSSTSSPESTATKTIFLLVCTFVYFNTLSSVFQIVLSVFDCPTWYLVNTSSVISLCFPAVSPFLLMSRDPRVSMVCFPCIRNIKCPHFMRIV
uniref:Vomeronasal type-1 receptor n=1 Tax=Herpailurus yagouaroundi TaxID=1608482 RepID=A0A0A0Y8B5_HERYA|nr:vomeronasal receptor type I [Puma yagouaroundi]